MADYKDYIVRYDIIADVTKAAEGLQSIANIAKEFEGPMNTLKTAITQVSQSVYQLKQNSQMTFAPKIDVGAFNNQLRAMVTQVRSAAAEMHAAIFEALSGNAAATKAAQKGIGTALGGNRSVAAIKKDIEAYNKELDKLLGTPKKNKRGETIRNRDGSIQMTKNALAKGNAQIQAQMQNRLLELEARKQMFQKMIQQRKAELAIAEKMEKEAAAQQAKASKTSAPATTVSRSTASQPAKLTNVTPAVIREWKKAFGDAKSKALTVNIRGNATGAGGALTVIEQIQASLKALQAQGTFNINPILNTEGFVAAEAQLRQLASLSAAVVAPFTPKDNKTKPGKAPSLVSTLTKDERTKLTNAQKQIKAWNEKIAPIQSRLDANKAIPEEQRTPAIKGQITRDTKTLATYQANKAEQENIVKGLQAKSAAAVKTATTAAKPLSLDIVGNLSKINITAKAPVVPVVGEITKLQGKVSEAIPVNVKIMADQVQASVNSIPTPTLNVRVNLITDNTQQQVKRLTPQSGSVKAFSQSEVLTKDEQTQLVNAQKQIKELDKKITPIQSRLKKNLAVPKEDLTPPVKRQITTDTQKLAAYQTYKSEQENIVKDLQAKSAAAAQSTAANKPFAVEIIGNISKIEVTAKSPTVPIIGEITKLQGKVTEAIPVNVQISSDQVVAAIKSIPTPTLDVRVNLLTDGAKQQVQTLAGQVKQTPQPNPKSAKQTVAPTAQSHQIFTPPVFSADEEKQLNSLYSRFGSLSATQKKAAEAVSAAQKQMEKSGGSNRAFDRLRNAQREYGNIRNEYLDVQKQLQSLMFKQFQSTAQRALTDDEIRSGLKAQSIVDQLSKKKRLTAEQKTQMSEANKTLASLRAPAPVQSTATPASSTVAPVTTVPAKGPVVKMTKGKKATTVSITGRIDTSEIINQIQSIPRQTIPVAVKLMWERGAVGRQEQLKKLAGNIPPIVLNFDTAAALAKLEEFIAKVRAASPQNIKLTATGVPANTAATPASTKSQKATAPVTAPASTKVNKPTVIDQKKAGVIDPAKSLAQTKLPPISLHLDTSAATAALDEFVAKVKAASPQNIKLTATGVAANTAATTAPTKSQNVTTPVATPTSPKVKKPTVAAQKKVSGVAPAKGLAETKLPPISLHLDTSAATAALEEFVAKVKAASPQNIKLTANGSQGATGGTTQKSTKQSGTTGHQPLTPRQYRDNIGKHLSKGFQLPKNFSSMIADQERVRGWHLDQMRRDAISAFAQETPYEKYLKSLAPTTTGKGAKKVVWGKNMPEETAPKGMHWVRNNNLSSFLNPAQQKELGFLQGQEDKAAQKVAGMRTQVAESSKRLQTRITSTEQQFQALQNKLAPLRQQMNQLEEMKKPFLSLKKLNKTQRQAVARIEQSQALINQQIEAAQAPLLAQMRYNDQLMSRYQSLARGQIATAVESHRQTQSAFGRYTEGWSLAPNQGQVSAAHLNKASKLQTQFHNAMLPFAPNKGQMDMLMKHRRYFKQAIKTTGITPTPGMAAPQMLQYLQGVSSQMQQSSVAVPWQLQSQINKLQGDVAKSKGIGEPAASRSAGMTPMPAHQKPFFDRSRKWAYPFTGQTSFGVRTPMAVDMAKGMGVMFAIGGAMSAIGSSFSQAMEYQNTMRTTQAILQNGTDTYSQNSFKNMEETVRNVGVKTKFSAPEVASAARFLAMAGYDIDAINASIRPIADLALIGDSDLGETADKMTNIMTTFQIAPERMREAANIMATTATRSNTDLMMLAESAKYGGGVANMYGRNDPNLFADTMALFGVMGNAGIQASSAGTALRMMYQNLFKPNKNQKAVLDMMKQDYKITTVKEDGSYRSMSDILIEMAQRIPENQMAQIVGNLFRITAQPGAAATLLAAAGGDKSIAEEIGAGIETMSSKMSSKAGLSSLVSLMLANRNSVSGNISGAIAEEKQNTISGLWAQVTSTFTEGIVQAFEKRQGGFEEMLRKLRDYLAKPETIQMMQNLLDMIIEIGKVMAWFVKIWASLYNAAPGLIKFWITFQMGITQMGALIAPIISLIGVFDRLKGSIMTLAGISAVGGSTVTRNVAGSVAAGTAANAAVAGTPFIVGTGKHGANKVIRGNIATRAHNAMAANAILAGELALSGANKQTTLAALNKETRQHYAAVRDRAVKIYGSARAGRAFRAAFTAVPTMASFAPMFGGIKSMFMGLMTNLAKAIGLLTNPITLATGAVVGLGFGLYKLKQFADGNTEAQILAQQQMATLSSEAVQTMVNNYKWYQEQIDKYKNPAQPLYAVGTSTAQREYETQTENFRSEYADIIKGNLSKNASEKGIRQQVEAFRERVNKNNLYKYAFGDDYEKYVGAGLTEDNSSLKYTGTQSDGGIALYNLLFAPKRHAKEVQNREIQAALRTAGVNRPEIQAAHEEIVRLRQLYLDGELTENDYLKKAYEVRDKVVNINNPYLRSSEGLTLEAFQNISDPSVYSEYALGQYNVLNSFINGDDGTIVAKLNAQKALRDRLVVSGEEYWRAISNVIGDYPIQFKAVSMDDKVVKDIELSLSMIPNTGLIDFNAVAAQIQSKIGEFKKNLEDFANMTAKVYKAMADAGLVPNTEEDMNSFVWQQMEHAHITKEQATSYFHNYLPENSIWKRAGKTLEEWQQFVTDPNGQVVINGRTYHASTQRQAIRRRLTNNAVSTMMETVNKTKAATTQPTPTSPAAPSITTTPSTTTNQTAYGSHYDRSTARPTQVVFNINNLASFDRTTVASSAKERDLMAAMEERIASAVYTMFAEASNQAQRVMDLT